MTGRGAVPGGGRPGDGEARRGGRSVTCDELREAAPELALGGIDDPERARLFAHAAGCPACQARLDELALLVDQLLVAAPELEPPAGFEGRVLDHLATAAAGGGPGGPGATPARPGGASTAPSTAPSTPPSTVAIGARRSRRRRLLAVAAVVVLLALLGGAVGLVRAGRDEGGDTSQAASSTSTSGPADGADPGGQATLQSISSGPILRADGSRSGTAMLVDEPRPLVLVTIDSPRPSANRVSCELVLPDGTATTVGTWGYDDVAGGAWAVGIAPDLLGAVRMNVRDAAGNIVASAALV